MFSRLENSFRRLSDFSSDLAHEFRTPISNLMTQSQVTLSKPRAPAEYAGVLASNVEELERLSHMVADMLFIAKADEGQIVPCRKAVALAGLVDELVDFYRLATDEKEIALSASGSAEIEGDPLMLRRALSNLIANAVGHTPAGGRIAVRIEKADAASVRLVVENTGETIAPQHLPRLFDRFYRVDASRHRASEGAGLGLAITQSIAEAHGGTVSVRSSEGVTVFELLLPA
jgi:two-component system heavy metal sensor histidine kinase CusS